jgi:hypothetical protein
MEKEKNHLKNELSIRNEMILPPKTGPSGFKRTQISVKLKTPAKQNHSFLLV